MLYLVTGPSNSGKSARAEALAVSLSGGEAPLVYLATMIPYGEEGTDRVERHRKMREGKGFTTIERPLDVGGLVLKDLGFGPSSVVLLECMVNLTANELFASSGHRASVVDRAHAARTERRVVEAVDHLKSQCRHLIVVSGSLEWDVCYDCGTRTYLRTLGRINERLLRLADERIEAMAPPVGVKGNPHGGNIYRASRERGGHEEEWMDLSANINPMGVPTSVRRAMEQSLDAAVRYPDPDSHQLIQSIARRHQVGQGQIACGNGAADLIYRIVSSIRPARALITAPSFSEYEEALIQAGADIICYGCRLRALPQTAGGVEQSAYAGELAVEEDILDWMDGELDLMFLASPDNPSGALIPPSLLIRIAEKAGRLGIWLVVDECFLDFVPEGERLSLAGGLERFPRLLVLKSFTKMYAIPGLRLGYVLGSDSDRMESLRLSGPSWPINCVAEAAGIAALRESGFARESARLAGQEREFLARELSRLGCLVVRGEACYLLFRDGRQGADLCGELAKRHILIRRCDGYRGLSGGWYRVAVRGRGENERFLAAVREILDGFSG